MTQLAINGGQMAAEDLERVEWPRCTDLSIEYVRRCLESGAWCRKSPGAQWVDRFEERWADHQDAEHALAVNSGSVALKLALRACNVGAGDEVLVPSYTFRATASAVLDLGAVPRFVDVDPDTYAIEPDAVANAITDRTAAVVAVHFSGYPIDFDELLPVVEDHDLSLIEDAAQAQNTEWRGRRVGAIGDVGVFSFQDMKILAGGEGGVLVTNDETIYGRAKAQHDYLAESSGDVATSSSMNYRLSELHGALLTAQLENLPAENERKATAASRLRERLDGIEGVTPKPDDERITNRGFYHFTFKYDSDAFDGLGRRPFLEALNAEGVPAHLPAFNEPLYQKEAFSPTRIRRQLPDHVDASLQSDLHHPGAEEIAEKGAMLRHPLLLVDEERIELVADSIEKIKRRVRETR